MPYYINPDAPLAGNVVFAIVPHPDDIGGVPREIVNDLNFSRTGATGGTGIVDRSGTTVIRILGEGLAGTANYWTSPDLTTYVAPFSASNQISALCVLRGGTLATIPGVDPCPWSISDTSISNVSFLKFWGDTDNSGGYQLTDVSSVTTGAKDQFGSGIFGTGSSHDLGMELDAVPAGNAAIHGSQTECRVEKGVAVNASSVTPSLTTMPWDVLTIGALKRTSVTQVWSVQSDVDLDIEAILLFDKDLTSAEWATVNTQANIIANLLTESLGGAPSTSGRNYYYYG